MGSTLIKMVYRKGGGSETVPTSSKEQISWSASGKEVEDLAVTAVKIGKHHGRPMDIERARDGDDGKLHIVQGRPETVASPKNVGVIEDYEMMEKGKEIPAEGRAVRERFGSGKVGILGGFDGMPAFQEGQALRA